MTPETLAVIACLACTISVLAAVASCRRLGQMHDAAVPKGAGRAAPVLHDASTRVRYLRALAAIGTTLEAMRANFDRGSVPVFGNVEPPVAQLAELSAAAAPLGRSLDVGILHATLYWLREHGYQRAFTNPSPELHECRARINAALWETHRLLGIAQDVPLPRTLADVEALAELATPPAVSVPAPRERGRRVAARREGCPAVLPTPRAATAR